jgi:hypothetical protein
MCQVVLHLQQTPCPADDVGAGGGSRDQGLASSRTLSIKRVLTPKKNTAYVQLDSQGNFAPVSQVGGLLAPCASSTKGFKLEVMW